MVLWPEADFPRTSTGKPKLTEIREAVEAQWGSGDASADWPATKGGIGELIAKMKGDGHPIDPSANLESDLRLSSLDRVELLGALEDRYQVDVNETRFTSARTVGELETLVRGSSSTRTEFVFPRWAQRWPMTWIRTFVYYLLTWPATHLMAHPRVFGRENLRGGKRPQCWWFATHVIYLHVGFVLAALPMRLRRAARGGDEWGAPRGNAEASPRNGFPAALVATHELFSGRIAFQRLPLAKKLRLPGKFSFRR